MERRHSTPADERAEPTAAAIPAPLPPAQAQLLALQRRAGNRAATAVAKRILARDVPIPEGLSADEHAAAVEARRQAALRRSNPDLAEDTEDADETPPESTGARWRQGVLAGLADELAWELGMIDEIDILDRALDLAKQNPNPEPGISTPEDAFAFWIGWRVPWVQAGRGAAFTRLARFGISRAGVRTLAGLRHSLLAVFRAALGRAVELNHHVAQRFLQRCLSVGGELEGITFAHLRHAIRFGSYFRDGLTGSVIAVHGRVAIAMTVKGPGKVIIRTIEPSTQFLGSSPLISVGGRMVPRFTRIAKPF